MALKDAINHPDFWGEGVTDEDRIWGLSQQDAKFAEKPLAEKQTFVKNLAATREKAARDAAQAQQKAAQESQSWLQRTGSALGSVAAPIRDMATNAVGMGMEAVTEPLVPLARLAQGEGMQSFSPEGRGGRTIGHGGAAAATRNQAAKVVVPQTATELGMAAGTLAAGPVLGVAGKAVPALARTLSGVGNASRAIPAAARIVGTGVGGALGGALGQAAGNEEESAASGGLQGLLAGTVGEAASYGAGKLARSAPGAQRRVAKADAERLGQTVEEISPALKGARTADALYDMASGKGRAALGKQKEAVIDSIDSLLSLSNQGPSLRIASLQSGPGGMSLKEANRLLSKVGEKAFSKNPLDRTINGVDQRELWHKASKEIETALDKAGPGLGQMWRSAQGEYSTGRTLLDELLRTTGMYKGESRGRQLDITKLQRLFNDPDTKAELQRHMTPEQYKKAVAAITRGGKEGAEDIIRSLAPLTSVGGLTRGATGLAGLLAGGPLGAVAGAIAPSLLPNVASKYAGKTPLTASKEAKILADLVAGRLTPSPGEMSAKARKEWERYNEEQQ